MHMHEPYTVGVNSKFLKRQSKAKCRAPAYLQALSLFASVELNYELIYSTSPEFIYKTELIYKRWTYIQTLSLFTSDEIINKGWACHERILKFEMGAHRLGRKEEQQRMRI